MGVFYSNLNKQRHWLVILAWVAITIICWAAHPYLGKPFKIGEISNPKAESTLAQKTIQKEFPFSGGQIYLLFKSERYTANQNNFKSVVTKSLNNLKKLPFEIQVSSPYDHSKHISSDKHEAYAVIKTNLISEELANHMPQVRKLLDNPKDVTIFTGGEPSYISDVYALSESNLIRGELIALPICFLVMVFVFGGFVAAFITILSGVISITVIITTLYILGHYIDLTVFVLNIATMLGLGLSLDYTLLLTYRFREEFARCHDCKRTIEITLSTAGTSIFFSGLIVLLSIGLLIFFPINVLYSIGVAGVVVVLVTVLCSLTFLPSVLCLLERKVARKNPTLQQLAGEDIKHHHWYRFAWLVMKHPFLFMIPTIMVLLMLGYPFLHVKLNSSDAKILPTWVESRKLLDQFNENFDPNRLNPILVLMKSKNPSILSKSNISALYDYVQHLKEDERVSDLSSIVTIKSGLNKRQYQTIYSNTSKLPFNDQQKQLFNDTTKGPYTLMSIISKYPKDDVKSFDLVKAIRADTVRNNISKQVTGGSAKIIDTIKSAYGLFFKLIIVISLITYFTLMWLLRSIFLPFKAILMNFLSLSVCYGMLVFIFQEGHFAEILNFKALGFTDMNIPILIFFALFGLSMDYEVFLLTRIKEYYDKTGDNDKSVALGLERSGRIITSAALIVVIVSGAFVTADIVFIKAFGLGTALAIAVDATLIRLLLVPATMQLLGDWNWYLPKWLDRLLPNIKLEKGSHCPTPIDSNKT